MTSFPQSEHGTIFEQIERDGSAGAAARRPSPAGSSTTRRGPIGREVSHVFRGLVSAEEASAVLKQAGLDWLRLVDNGVISGHGDQLFAPDWTIDVERVHCYHLIPSPASKARGVARHMQIRGYLP